MAWEHGNLKTDTNTYTILHYFRLQIQEEITGFETDIR